MNHKITYLLGVFITALAISTTSFAQAGDGNDWYKPGHVSEAKIHKAMKEAWSDWKAERKAVKSNAKEQSNVSEASFFSVGKNVMASELLEYQAKNVEFEDMRVTKATITNKNGEVVCQIDNPLQHPDHANVVYQNCSDDTVVSVYYDKKWIKEFHFRVYDAGDDEPFAEAWIQVSDCKTNGASPVKLSSTSIYDYIPRGDKLAQ